MTRDLPPMPLRSDEQVLSKLRTEDFCDRVFWALAVLDAICANILYYPGSTLAWLFALISVLSVAAALGRGPAAREWTRRQEARR